MADFGVRAHDALRLVAEKMHRAALRHVGSTIRVGGVARGVVGHRVDRAAVHDTVGILALGADLKLEDRVVGLDKFRFNEIIGGKKILLVQFRRLLGGCELFHESAPLTLLLSYPTTVRR